MAEFISDSNGFTAMMHTREAQERSCKTGAAAMINTHEAKEQSYK